MSVMLSVVLFPVIVLLVISLVHFITKEKISGMKIMILGIHVTLLGGILVIDPTSSFGGMEYLIVLLGLVISAYGFGKKD